MKKLLLIFALSFFAFSSIIAQKILTYYLPDVSYDESVTTPEAFFGFQVGEWHLSHDKLSSYMKEVASKSDRVVIEEFARSYEARPLQLLVITSPKNHKNIEAIREQHLQLTDAKASSKLNVEDMPIVIYQGYSIHGNEPSGSNAASLWAYYLAAAQDDELSKMLEDVVILLDPSYNPDGLTRFANWVNVHKGKNLTADPQSRELNEYWPKGRTNHYWFDMNRDWITTAHPESKGRIKNFHKWKPNILTDHHEMGSNSTYFFQPGVPSRINPLTPKKNQVLTKKIAAYHAKYLDEIGSLYYSEESFDDYFSGKGSTYPDANGSIGILFEQGSARGHLRQTENGLLSFPFAIRNHVRTSMSTLKAGYELKNEILNYQRDFFKETNRQAKNDIKKAYVFEENYDRNKLKNFIDMLKRHKIKVYKLKNGYKSYNASNSYVVPLAQQQYKFIKAIFEPQNTFTDSVFYDVSAWTKPMAFNLKYASVMGKQFNNLLGDLVTDTKDITKITLPEKTDYAYIFEWDDFLSPKALGNLMKAGLRTKVAEIPFQLSGKKYNAGAIIIPVQNQKKSSEEIYELIKATSESTGINIVGVSTGLTEAGIDLGSPNVFNLKVPKVALLVGKSVTSYDAGEVWHLFDQHYDMPISMLDVTDLASMDLTKYNTIVMVDGSYDKLTKKGLENLKKRIKGGAVLIAVKGAVKWVQKNKIIPIELKEVEKDSTRQPYHNRNQNFGSMSIGGSIFETTLDTSHPLGFGYRNPTLPIFRKGDVFIKHGKNPYATPLVYTKEPLLSGYIRGKNYEMIKSSASILVGGYGQGKVICMADNFIFRAAWQGTTKLFANAVFFGQMIDGRTLEKVEKKEK